MTVNLDVQANLDEKITSFEQVPFGKIITRDGLRFFVLETRELAPLIDLFGERFHKNDEPVSYSIAKAGETIETLQRDSQGRVVSQSSYTSEKGGEYILKKMRSNGVEDVWLCK